MNKLVILSSQISLIVINFIILAFGLVAIGIGIWVASTDRDYLNISGQDKNYDGVAVLLAIVGFFVLIVGGIGFVGVLCGKRMSGRIMMIVYAVIVAIIILMVLSGAIAAYVKRDDLRDTFHDDALKTLDALNDTTSHTSNLKVWNDAQIEVHCCGANNYTDWLRITWHENVTNVIPISCCAEVGGCDVEYIEIGADGKPKQRVWTEGCVNAIVDKVSDQIGAVAGISITIGVIMIIAMVMACILGICNKPDQYKMV